MHRVADLVADYVEKVGGMPVLPRIAPGEVGKALPAAPPAEGEPLDRLLDDYQSLIEPNVTHWNHPGFLAYFANTASAPGIVGEALAAALNVNAMLWRTSVAATELEERVCDWVRRMMDLPPGFTGHINDTASTGSLVALAAARHGLPGLDIRRRGMAGRPDLPRLVLYAGDQAHSSIDKAAIVLGIGQENVRRVAADDAFRLSVPALAAAIARDRAAGCLPLAVVATAGSTSTTSVDPIPEIAEICRAQKIWLHVDAAYAGSAAICPELRALMPGLELADSLVVNPHKWLFTPVDCSLLYVRDPALLRAAFSHVADYLRTDEAGVTNLMDYGFQLGRRFRALKLWMVIRAFGVEGLRRRIRAQCAMARDFAARIGAEPGFELAAPVPFSAVCFRARLRPAGEAAAGVERAAGAQTSAEQGGAAGADETAEEAAEDRFNGRVLAQVNACGPFFISHTVLRGRYVLRVAIGNLRTQPEQLDALFDLLVATAGRLRRLEQVA
jgi:aromatic-L-amino-acid decarboxylase